MELYIFQEAPGHGEATPLGQARLQDGQILCDDPRFSDWLESKLASVCSLPNVPKDEQRLAEALCEACCGTYVFISTDPTPFK